MSPFRVEFLPSAVRDFSGLEPSLQPRIARAAELIACEPTAGKPLQGPYHGLWSYRVGDYRLVYRLDFQARLAVILAIGHRRDIYRRRH